MALVVIGTISHGTLRVPDLLRSFSNELERLNPSHALLREARHNAEILEKLNPSQRDWDIASDILSELVEALNSYAPEGIYFGAHEGDGSDFGFWPNTEGES